MVIRRSETIDLTALEHSRSAREDALEYAQKSVLDAVLHAVSDDIELGFDEQNDKLTVSASLTTLNRREVAALTALLRAHSKGYSAETLHGLVGDLARVFRT